MANKPPSASALMAAAAIQASSPQIVSVEVISEAPDKVNAVKVCSLSPSGTFRRIGREFPHKGVEIPLSQLTDQELEILSHEPMLSLSFVEIDAEPAAA